uniref:Uncharacterized protein n=1 Tax=Aegilops tauschii subsp. strangulata TaxID=200361 RepID=A0A452YVI4_AEGTS
GSSRRPRPPATCPSRRPTRRCSPSWPSCRVTTRRRGREPRGRPTDWTLHRSSYGLSGVRFAETIIRPRSV